MSGRRWRVLGRLTAKVYNRMMMLTVVVTMNLRRRRVLERVLERVLGRGIPRGLIARQSTALVKRANSLLQKLAPQASTTGPNPIAMCLSSVVVASIKLLLNID